MKFVKFDVGEEPKVQVKLVVTPDQRCVQLVLFDGAESETIAMLQDGELFLRGISREFANRNQIKLAGDDSVRCRSPLWQTR